MVNKGYKQTKEHREKIRLFRRDKSYEEIYGTEKARGIREKLSKSHLGQFPSKESLEKRRLSMLKIMTEDRKRQISDNLRGRKVSIETREKIRLANKGKYPSFRGKHHTKEIIERIRKANIGKELSEKTKEKIRKARVNQIFPIKDSSIEVKIQNFLKELGIEFFTHQYMKIEHGYQCDIFIPSKNLVIECDGEYWHKYPTGNDIDHIRTSELIQRGFKVLRLWEFEINDMKLNDFAIKLKQ